jgi:DnaJ-class molecular chaperone
MKESLIKLLNGFPYTICENCNGNGYIRLKKDDLKSATITCAVCGGDGHKKTDNSQKSSNNDPAVETMKLVDYLNVKKRTH